MHVCGPFLLSSHTHISSDFNRSLWMCKEGRIGLWKDWLQFLNECLFISDEMSHSQYYYLYSRDPSWGQGCTVQTHKRQSLLRIAYNLKRQRKHYYFHFTAGNWEIKWLAQGNTGNQLLNPDLSPSPNTLIISFLSYLLALCSFSTVLIKILIIMIIISPVLVTVPHI